MPEKKKWDPKKVRVHIPGFGRRNSKPERALRLNQLYKNRAKKVVQETGAYQKVFPKVLQMHRKATRGELKFQDVFADVQFEAGDFFIDHFVKDNQKRKQAKELNATKHRLEVLRYQLQAGVQVNLSTLSDAIEIMIEMDKKDPKIKPEIIDYLKGINEDVIHGIAHGTGKQIFDPAAARIFLEFLNPERTKMILRIGKIVGRHVSAQISACTDELQHQIFHELKKH